MSLRREYLLVGDRGIRRPFRCRRVCFLFAETGEYNGNNNEKINRRRLAGRRAADTACYVSLLLLRGRTPNTRLELATVVTRCSPRYDGYRADRTIRYEINIV